MIQLKVFLIFEGDDWDLNLLSSVEVNGAPEWWISQPPALKKSHETM